MSGEEAPFAVASIEVRAGNQVFDERVWVKEEPDFFLDGELPPSMLPGRSLIVWPSKHVL
jgi:hypothetical protein